MGGYNAPNQHQLINRNVHSETFHVSILGRTTAAITQSSFTSKEEDTDCVLLAKIHTIQITLSMNNTNKL